MRKMLIGLIGIFTIASVGYCQELNQPSKVTESISQIQDWLANNLSVLITSVDLPKKEWKGSFVIHVTLENKEKDEIGNFNNERLSACLAGPGFIIKLDNNFYEYSGNLEMKCGPVIRAGTKFDIIINTGGFRQIEKPGNGPNYDGKELKLGQGGHRLSVLYKVQNRDDHRYYYVPSQELTINVP